MNRNFFHIILFCLFITMVVACKHHPEEMTPPPDTFNPTYIDLEIPPFFPPMDIPVDNPLTEEGVLLGRYLFWEKKLSGNNLMSCATCHLPEFGFSDPNQFSTGINGEIGNRQAMALVNLGWAYNFFWDGRAGSIEDQVQQPVENPIEMAEDWDNAILELAADTLYPPLFEAAFGSSAITQDRSAKALAQFLRMLISSNSKFDKQRIGQYDFTADEEAGFDLFLAEGGQQGVGGADCFHCHGHSGMQMGDYLFHNNGLDQHFVADPGLAIITGNPLDSGKFKTPSLRNIELTAPYMHDGRFATLDQVLDHYNTGGEISTTIDPFMEAAGGGLFLDDTKKQQVMAFLKCLTDTSFINNEAFSDPN
ncbi:MAG: cytochrome c peroxidase [Flavobacteriales bacterium]|nr:cytochrome c peroxidase [Flavobacteriales bacterium]